MLPNSAITALDIYSNTKNLEYDNSEVYFDLKWDFKKGDFIHVYGYYKEVQKEDKTYRNFIVKHVNKIDKGMESKKEQDENKEE